MGKSIHLIGLFKVLRQALFACPVTRIIILLKYPFLSVFKMSFLNSVDIHWQETVGVVFLRHCIALGLAYRWVVGRECAYSRAIGLRESVGARASYALKNRSFLTVS